MATFRVRWDTGDIDEWEIHDKIQIDDFYDAVVRATKSGGVIGFGTMAGSGSHVEYGHVCIQTKAVRYWQVDNVIDSEGMLSWLAATDE